MPPDEAKATIPKTNVKSAIFEPNRVPNPSWEFPFIADIIEIVASGKTETTAIIKKLTINSGRWSALAIFEEYLIAYPANFTSIIKKSIASPKLTIIIFHLFYMMHIFLTFKNISLSIYLYI